MVQQINWQNVRIFPNYDAALDVACPNGGTMEFVRISYSFTATYIYFNCIFGESETGLDIRNVKWDFLVENTITRCLALALFKLTLQINDLYRWHSKKNEFAKRCRDKSPKGIELNDGEHPIRSAAAAVACHRFGPKFVLRVTRDREKKELSDLNDRLAANYIEKVGFGPAERGQARPKRQTEDN
ncbi:hypothetical protein niasHT_027463 [Heterodera trifolii]|uniref:Uncharacterized protein n=1 Tax=Heterodera trifolii TaxID=157864 RepID=A0ABD2JMM6_9BILA